LKKNKLDEFAKEFESQILPTIKGADGKGIERFKKIVEEKREEVANRKKAKENKAMKH
jgi:hypothetical protein